MDIDYYETGRAIGMTKKEARLWAKCCETEAHYQALRRQGASRSLIEQAHRAWDDAAWAYANWRKA